MEMVKQKKKPSRFVNNLKFNQNLKLKEKKNLTVKVYEYYIVWMNISFVFKSSFLPILSSNYICKPKIYIIR